MKIFFVLLLSTLSTSLFADICTVNSLEIAAKRVAQGSLRAALAEKVLGIKLTAEQRLAVDRAHNIGIGHIGRDGTIARPGNFNDQQEQDKYNVLANTGLTKTQIKPLMDLAICGAQPNPEAANYYDRLGVLPTDTFAQIQAAKKAADQLFPGSAEIKEAYNALSSNASRKKYDLIAPESQLVAEQKAAKQQAATEAELKTFIAGVGEQVLKSSFKTEWETKHAELPTARRKEIEAYMDNVVKREVVEQYSERLFNYLISVEKSSAITGAADLADANERKFRLHQALAAGAFMIPLRAAGVQRYKSGGEEISVEEYLVYLHDLAAYESFVSYNLNYYYVSTTQVGTLVETLFKPMAQGATRGERGKNKEGVDEIIRKMETMPRTKI